MEKSKEELERLIVDASDGVLSRNEIKKLENELRNHPDLYQDYRAVMNLPELSNLYPFDMKPEQHQKSINKILKDIRGHSTVQESFEVITLDWFRRYALAASLVIFAVTSLLSVYQNRNEPAPEDSEVIAEELFYPIDENTVADNYILYLEDLTND